MAKRKKQNLSSIFTLVEIVLAVICLIMVFLPACGFTLNETEYNLTGLQTITGYTESIGSIIKIEYNLTVFSFMNLIPYLLVLVVAVLAVLKLVLKKSNKTIINLVIALLFVVSLVLVALTINCLVLHEDIEQMNSLFGGDFKEGLELRVGAIIFIIVAVLGALTSLVETGYSLKK